MHYNADRIEVPLLSQGRRIAGSSTALLIGNFANKVTGLLVMLTVARLLGVDRLGLYTAVYAYVIMFSLATDLGFSTVVTRQLSQDVDEGRRWLGNALLLRWPLAIISYVICIGGAFLFYGSGERTWLIVISAVSFLLSPLSASTAVFQSRMLLRIPTTISLASRLLLLVVVQWLARTGGTIQALVVAEVTLGAMNSITVWLWSRWLIKPIWQFDWTAVRALMIEGVPLFLTSAFVALYFRIDVFFIDHYRVQSLSEIGVYAAAYRLTESMGLIAQALTSSIFPVLCQQIQAGSQASLVKLIRISLKILLGVAVAIAIVLTFYSQTVITLLYGGKFEGAAPLLAILACNQILVYTNILTSTILVARGQSRTLMLITMAMLVWNIALNFLFIPRYGALGAAWTTMSTELAGTVCCVLATSTGKVLFETITRLAIPAVACMGLLLLFAPGQANSRMAAIEQMSAVLTVYTAAVMLLRVFNSEEREHLRRLAWQ